MVEKWMDVFDWADASEDFYEKHREGWEKAIYYTLLTAVVLLVIGAAGMVVNYLNTYYFGTWLFSLGLILAAVSMIFSAPVDTLRVVFREQTGGTTYDRRRYWNRFKTMGILLNLLGIVAAGVLFVALLVRVDALSMEGIAFDLVIRLVGLFVLLFGAVILYTYYLSLRTPIERQRPKGVEGLMFTLTTAGVLVFAIVSAIVATRPLEILGVEPTDAPFFVIMSVGLAGLALYLGRHPPTLRILWTDERQYYAGMTYLSRRKSIVLPALMAFAMLFVVVLVMFVFGIGVVGLFEEVPTNRILFGVFGFIIVAMITTVAIAYVLSRSEDTAALYQEKRTLEERQDLMVMGVSAALATIFLILSAVLFTGRTFLGLQEYHWLDLFALALLGGLGPYGFYVHRGYRRRKSLEERFPDFLRDLAASNRAGLTLTSAVQIAAKGEYGALTPEILKMADQLSWNVPFYEALERFADRVETPLVGRSVNLINEASRSGGNVTDVILAAARDAREIKNLESERKTTMMLYTAVIYITFLVFLVTMGVLYGTFIPQLVATTQATRGAGGGFGGFGFSSLTLNDYRTFYYLAAIVQAVGNGFVAGLIENGRVLSGMRHAFWMTLISLVTFVFLV